MNKEKKILLKPALSMVEKYFESYDEIVHKPQVERLKDILKSAVVRIRNLKSIECENDFGLTKRYDTILITGQRGSGKTSFLRTVMWNLSQPLEKRMPALQFSGSDRLCSLGIIDPTLIGNREHILMLIIQKIENSIKNLYDNTLAHDSSSRFTDHEYYAWLESLRTLSKGLQVLGEDDDINTSRKFTWDEQGYMDEGLERVRGSFNLECFFHLFIEKSIRLLGKHAFIIALDDVDIKPDLGMHILEVLRKYLTTPRLIVLATADQSMFRMSIQKDFYQRFALRKESLISDNFKNNYENSIDSIVFNFSDQYFLKLFDPSKIINLSSVLDYILHGYLIEVEWGDDQNEPPSQLIKIIENIAGEIFHLVHKEAIQNFSNFLFTIPLRSLVRLLSVLRSSEEDEFTLNRLANLFSTSLQELGYTSNELEISPGVREMHLLLQRLQQNNVLNKGISLEVFSDKPSLNGAMITLGLYFLRAIIKDPCKLLDYFINICLTAGLQRYNNLPFGQFLDYLQVDGDTHSSFLTAMKLTASASSANLMQYKSLYLGVARLYIDISKEVFEHYFEYKNGNKFPTGKTIEIMNFHIVTENAGVDTRNTRIKRYANNIFTLQDSITSWHKNYYTFPFCVVSHKGMQHSLLSLYNILGCISSLLSNRYIFSTLRSMSTLQIYPVFMEKSDKFESQAMQVKKRPLTESINAVVDDTLREKIFQEGTEKPFLQILEQWQGSWAHAKIEIHPGLLVRIARRYITNQISVDQGLPKNMRLTGVWLHRSLVAFFNSVLVEEYLALGADIDAQESEVAVDLRAPVTSDDIFVRNMAKLGLLREVQPIDPLNQNGLLGQAYQYVLQETKEPTVAEFQIESIFKAGNSKLKLFPLIFSCPLWGLYLRPPYFNFEKSESASDEAKQGIFNERFSVFNQHAEYARCEIDRKSFLECLVVSYAKYGKFPNFYTPFQSLPIITSKSGTS